MLGQLLRAGAETSGGQHDGPGGDRVAADRDAQHPAVVHEQPIDPLAERDVDVPFAAVAVEDVDDRPAPLPTGTCTRAHRLVATDDELVVVLDAQIAEPLHDGAGRARRAGCTTAGVDVPAVHLEVVVEERVGVVVDAELGLVARAGAHDQASRQARRAADHALGLCDEDARCTGLVGREGGAETSHSRADDQDIDIEALVHGTPQCSPCTVGDGPGRPIRHQASTDPGVR